MTLQKALEIVSLLVQGDANLDPNDVHDALQLCQKYLKFMEQLFGIIKTLKLQDDPATP